MKREDIDSWKAYVDNLAVEHGLDTVEVTPGDERFLRKDLPPVKILNGSIGLGNTIQSGPSGDISLDQISQLLQSAK